MDIVTTLVGVKLRVLPSLMPTGGDIRRVMI